MRLHRLPFMNDSWRYMLPVFVCITQFLYALYVLYTYSTAVLPAQRRWHSSNWGTPCQLQSHCYFPCRQSFEEEWEGRRGRGEECTLEVTGPTRTVLAETIEEGEGEGRRNNHPQYTAMYIYWTCYSITEKYMFYKLHMRRRWNINCICCANDLTKPPAPNPFMLHCTPLDVTTCHWIRASDHTVCQKIAS